MVVEVTLTSADPPPVGDPTKRANQQGPRDEARQMIFPSDVGGSRALYFVRIFEAGVAPIYRLDERPETGASLAYPQPAAEGLKSHINLSPCISQRLNDRVGISFYASTGLTDASPRLGAGLALKFSR